MDTVHVKVMDAALANGIPVGAIITDSYWTLPDGYTAGPRFDDETAAIAAAVEVKLAAIQAHRAVRGNRYAPLPERMTIDHRWTMEFPTGGGSDFVASRITFGSVADAQANLDLRRRIAGTSTVLPQSGTE